MKASQMKDFFRMCERLGYNKITAKDRAKAKYGKTHFFDVTSDEIEPILKILRDKEKALDDTVKIVEKRELGFPLEYQVWDTHEKIMLEGEGAVTAMEFADKKEALLERFKMRWWTGAKDDSGERLFEGDFVESKLGKRFLIEWSWSDCAWIVKDLVTGENIFLSSLGSKKKVGTIYDER